MDMVEGGKWKGDFVGPTWKTFGAMGVLVHFLAKSHSFSLLSLLNHCVIMLTLFWQKTNITIFKFFKG